MGGTTLSQRAYRLNTAGTLGLQSLVVSAVLLSVLVVPAFAGDLDRARQLMAAEQYGSTVQLLSTLIASNPEDAEAYLPTVPGMKTLESRARRVTARGPGPGPGGQPRRR